MVDGRRAAHLLTLAALMVVVVMAGFVVLALRTGNHWDAAPLCAAGQIGRRCVTEVKGELSPQGFVTCSDSQYTMGCSDLPVDISFEGGITRHMVLKDNGGPIFGLSGGQRYLGVVPQHDAPVVGRFYRDHLVELVFPSTHTHLATDDFPGHTINGLAQAGLIGAPFVGVLVVGFVAWRVHRRQRPRRRRTSGESDAQSRARKEAWRVLKRNVSDVVHRRMLAAFTRPALLVEQILYLVTGVQPPERYACNFLPAKRGAVNGRPRCRTERALGSWFSVPGPFPRSGCAWKR